MSLNRTAIDWAHCFGPGSGFTWNPVVGCTYGCPYCYARGQAKRQKHNCRQCYDFTPHLHPERMEGPLHRRKPAGIFLGSMTDLYGPEVPQEWRDQVWDVCGRTPQHQYFVLTKQPQNITDAEDVPENVLLGFSAVDQRDFVWRSGEFWGRCGHRPCMVSLEPLFGWVDNLIGLDERDWLVIGAQTGRGAVPPTEGMVAVACETARERGVPVYCKQNLEACGITGYMRDGQRVLLPVQGPACLADRAREARP